MHSLPNITTANLSLYHFSRNKRNLSNFTIHQRINTAAEQVVNGLYSTFWLNSNEWKFRYVWAIWCNLNVSSTRLVIVGMRALAISLVIRQLVGCGRTLWDDWSISYCVLTGTSVKAGTPCFPSRASHTWHRMQGCAVHRGRWNVGRKPSWWWLNSECHKLLCSLLNFPPWE